MRQCPRCNAPVRPFLVLGIDVTARSAFALAATAGLLALDLLFPLPVGYAAHQAMASALLILLGAGLVRFAGAYALVWPRALHACHSGSSWKDVVWLAIMSPVLCSASFWVWTAVHILVPRGP